ncbi:unnamed protein product, partial [Ixodes hexagonus]
DAFSYYRPRPLPIASARSSRLTRRTRGSWRSMNALLVICWTGSAARLRGWRTARRTTRCRECRRSWRSSGRT